MAGEPRARAGIADPGGEQEAGADAPWVRSFLLTQPGKTYRVESGDDAHTAAARDAVEAAARALTDAVVREAGVAEAAATPAPSGEDPQG